MTRSQGYNGQGRTTLRLEGTTQSARHFPVAPNRNIEHFALFLSLQDTGARVRAHRIRIYFLVYTHCLITMPNTAYHNIFNEILLLFCVNSVNTYYFV